MSGQATFGNSTFYRAEWADGPDVEAWLETMATGRTLNFPCGSMRWGDVRADIEPEHDPDVVGDLYDPPFEPRTFDTIYCDPPYSICSYDRIYGWIHDVWHLARRRLIVNMPQVGVRLRHSDRSYYVEERPPGPAMAIYHIFDRQDAALSEFQLVAESSGGDDQ